MKSICNLCQKEEELKYSHILPEFMYQNLYDPNPRRFYNLNVDLVNPEKSKKRIEQKGIREYLLCGSCEGLLSKYEKYAAKVLYTNEDDNDVKLANSSKTPNNKIFLYQYVGFKYKEFKIFLLSLLWRILITDHSDKYKADATIKEKLRIAIISEDPLEYDDFGCVMQVIQYSIGKMAWGFILEPHLTKHKDNLILNQLIDGFMYSFHFNSKELNMDEKSFFLKKDGSLEMIGRILFDDKVLFDNVSKAFAFFGKAVK